MAAAVEHHHADDAGDDLVEVAVGVLEHGARGEGDGADEVELGGPRRGELVGGDGGVAALRAADGEPAVAGTGLGDVAGGAHGVDDAVRFADA